jgi:hypothetical protein
MVHSGPKKKIVWKEERCPMPGWTSELLSVGSGHAVV